MFKKIKTMMSKVRNYIIEKKEQRRRKKTIKFLLFDLYNQYLRFGSNLVYYNVENKDLLAKGVEEERAELKKLRTEPIKTDGLSKEEIKKANTEVGIKVHKLNSQIEYYEKIVEEMEKNKKSVNETVFHYDNLYNALLSGDYKSKPRKVPNLKK